MARSDLLVAFKSNYLGIKSSLSEIGQLALYDQLLNESAKKTPDWTIVRKNEEFKAVILEMEALLERAGELVTNHVGKWK